MARVLVTRPLADAERTAHALSLREHVSVIAPVLTLHQRTPEVPHRLWQAVLLTSRNAANLLPRTVPKGIPCFVVGRTTGRAAEALGFEDIRIADGDAAALAALVRSTADKADGPLLYPCGVDRTGDLAERLGDDGFEVVTAPCYEMRIQPLPGAILTELSGGAFDAVLLYSPRSAMAFAEAVSGIAIPGSLRILALSDAVRAALSARLRPLAVAAARPNETALLNALDAI